LGTEKQFRWRWAVGGGYLTKEPERGGRPGQIKVPWVEKVWGGGVGGGRKVVLRGPQSWKIKKKLGSWEKPAERKRNDLGYRLGTRDHRPHCQIRVGENEKKVQDGSPRNRKTEIPLGAGSEKKYSCNISDQKGRKTGLWLAAREVQGNILSTRGGSYRGRGEKETPIATSLYHDVLKLEKSLTRGGRHWNENSLTRGEPTTKAQYSLWGILTF